MFTCGIFGKTEGRTSVKTPMFMFLAGHGSKVYHSIDLTAEAAYSNNDAFKWIRLTVCDFSSSDNCTTYELNKADYHGKYGSFIMYAYV